jgi:hypothetical protein
MMNGAVRSMSVAVGLGLIVFVLGGCDLGIGGTSSERPGSDVPPAAKVGTPRVVAESRDAFFKETGQILGQPFLAYWEQHGGVAVFGYPISNSLIETAEDNGEEYTVKYFERARFELHRATGDKVILGRLGAVLRRTERPAAPLPGARYFGETGHNLSGPFLKFWNEHGGLEIFGYPITEERTERHPTDGKDYKVQYFERSEFELHPEFTGTSFEVQLGLLGTQLYQQKYGH